MEAAASGLEEACFSSMENWRARAEWLAILGFFGAFCYGLLANYRGRTQESWPMAECAAAGTALAVLIVAQAGTHSATLVRALSHHQCLNVAILGQMFAVAGFYFHEVRLLWRGMNKSGEAS